MAEKLSLPNIPTSSMFIGDEEDKVLTVVWQEFFRGLYNRVGGLTAPTINEVAAASASELYRTEAKTDELEKRLIELQEQIALLVNPRSYDKRIDELEHLMQATPSESIRVQVPICMDYFDAIPARGSESNWHGGLLSLATAQALDSGPTDLPVTKGTGKLIIVINAGTDLVGEITVTGETIDRNTGASTLGDTDTIVVDALTTDNSSLDSNGNTVHSFVGAYITSKWFTGSVVLSTADLTLTDVDVYHVSFEQVNDSPELMLNTFDANIYTTNVAAEFDAYLHTLHVNGSKCNVDDEAELHVGADGETAIANKYWRLRRGRIDEFIDGTKDGFWVDIFYSNSPVYVEDVTVSVWLTKTLIIR